MPRRRDTLGRFLPNNPYPDNHFEQAYNLFEDQDQDINPLAKLFSNIEEPTHQELVENPFSLILPQERMVSVAQNQPNQATFEFPITNQHDNNHLKNIPTLVLSKFYGIIIEDSYTFLFKFDILYRSYDYTVDAHRLKLFPTTLKGALRWFISLGRDVTNNWEAMQTRFIEKYKEYCRSGNRGDDIITMQQKEDENLEDYISRFLVLLKKNSNHTLNQESQKLFLLRGVNDSCIEALDLIGGGYITQVPIGIQEH